MCSTRVSARAKSRKNNLMSLHCHILISGRDTTSKPILPLSHNHGSGHSDMIDDRSQRLRSDPHSRIDWVQ